MKKKRLRRTVALNKEMPFDDVHLSCSVQGANMIVRHLVTVQPNVYQSC